MLITIQKWKIRLMYRYHGGNYQYQKISLWNGPSIIRKNLRKIMLISKSSRYDLSTKIIIRCLS